MIDLYKQDALGKIRVWTIETVGDSLLIGHGVLGGTITDKIVPVTINFSGRGIDEQIELEFNSRVSKQLDRGYTRSVAEAHSSTMTNALALPLPMLAQPISKVNSSVGSYYRQYKYDGMRCLIHRSEEGLTAYSRGGKKIDTINHILEGLEIPVGATVDGELYLHGTPLQTIMSYAKKYQHETRSLHYIMYDVIRPVPYKERLEELNSYLIPISVSVAPTFMLESEASLQEEFELAKTLGYEGLILREPQAYYEAGKRSKSLIKVKSVLDDEFTIQDITSSIDGWAILHCGNFSVSAPGTVAEKLRIFQHRSDYLGRRVRVEFANYTRDEVPFHPVATNIV